MLDPWVPFRYTRHTSEQIDYFMKHAVEKPENTVVNMITVVFRGSGRMDKDSTPYRNVARFVDAIHGGLSESKIDDRITVLEKEPNE